MIHVDDVDKMFHFFTLPGLLGDKTSSGVSGIPLPEQCNSITLYFIMQRVWFQTS